MSVYYNSLGNDDILGKEIALLYYFKLFLYSNNKLKLFNRFGIGIGYVNKKFDFDKNYDNVAVGSNFNIHFNYSIGLDYKITKKLDLSIGIAFDHFSNANTFDPNLGINSITGYAGINFNIHDAIKKNKFDLPAYEKQNEVELYANIGGKRISALTNKYFTTASLGADYIRKPSRAFNFGFGADVFFDSSVETQLQETTIQYNKIDAYQTGIHGTVYLVYNQFSVSLQQGVYIGLTPKTNNYLFYNRGVVKLYVSKTMAIKVAMKSHLHILDYPEIGITYKL